MSNNFELLTCGGTWIATSTLHSLSHIFKYTAPIPTKTDGLLNCISWIIWLYHLDICTAPYSSNAQEEKIWYQPSNPFIASFVIITWFRQTTTGRRSIQLSITLHYSEYLAFKIIILIVEQLKKSYIIRKSIILYKWKL